MSDENFYQISFDSFLKASPPIISAGYPIMLRGRHGIGKSELIYQIAEMLGLPVVERRASQMTEGDLLGLPVHPVTEQMFNAHKLEIERKINEGEIAADQRIVELQKRQENMIGNSATQFSPPAWFKKACEEAVVLLLDELDRATTEVRQGVFEMGDSRKIAGRYLHPDTKIFACVNGGASGMEYQVAELDPAELDRWCVFDVSPTVQDWLNWAEDRGEIMPLICEFIKQNPEHLEHNEMFDASVVYPSRRSWARLNKTLGFVENFQENHVLTTTISSSMIGRDAAMTFADWCKNYKMYLTPEDVFEGRYKERWEKMDQNEHLTLVKKIFSETSNVHEILSGDPTSDEMNNLREYFLVLPGEVKAHMSKLFTSRPDGGAKIAWVSFDKFDGRKSNVKRAIKLAEDVKQAIADEVNEFRVEEDEDSD